MSWAKIDGTAANVIGLLNIDTGAKIVVHGSRVNYLSGVAGEPSVCIANRQTRNEIVKVFDQMCSELGVLDFTDRGSR